MKVYLVGYIAAGKKSWGQKLAKELNLNFVDTREIMETKSGLTFGELLKQKDLYIQLEQDALSEVSKMENVVVATSEMLPCRADNMDVLNKTGITFYLRAGLGCIMMKIVKDTNKIPFLRGMDADFIPDFIKMELDNRKVFYNKADLVYLSRYLKIDMLVDMVKGVDKTY